MIIPDPSIMLAALDTMAEKVLKKDARRALRLESIRDEIKVYILPSYESVEKLTRVIEAELEEAVNVTTSPPKAKTLQSKGEREGKDSGGKNQNSEGKDKGKDDPKGKGKFRNVKGKGRGSDDRSGPYDRPSSAPTEAAREPLRRVRLPGTVSPTVEAGGRLIPRPPPNPAETVTSAPSASAVPTRGTEERVRNYNIDDLQ